MSLTCTCVRCGHETQIDVDPALTVACPTCGAAPGRRCTRPSEHVAFGGAPHNARDLAAAAAGAYPLCDCPPPRGRGAPAQVHVQGSLFGVTP